MLFRRALVAFLLLPMIAHAGSATVAVAVNFSEPAREIVAAFHKKTGDAVVLSVGTTGNLATQVTQDAAFDVMLSGDDGRPKQLIADHYAVAGTNFTYAIGKLVLWSHTDGIEASAAALQSGNFNALAIPNPEASAYGMAALEVLQKLQARDRIAPKIVQGATLVQAYRLIDTGKAELGFVARSQMLNAPAGSRWIVPQDLYTPLRQEAVLLNRGADNPTAKAFLMFLHGPEAQAIIERYGYALGTPLKPSA